MAGTSIGLFAVPFISTNVTSVGVHWSQKHGVSVSVMGNSYNSKTGWTTQASVGMSFMVYEGEIFGGGNSSSNYHSSATDYPDFDDSSFKMRGGLMNADSDTDPPGKFGRKADEKGEYLDSGIGDKLYSSVRRELPSTNITYSRINNSITPYISILGSAVEGMRQSYKYGNNNIKYAQKINGIVKSSAALTLDSQLNAANMAKNLKMLGRGFNVLSIASAGLTLLNSNRSGADVARFAGSLIITGSAAIPFAGPLISIGLGAADANGAFDTIYNYFGQ